GRAHDRDGSGHEERLRHDQPPHLDLQPDPPGRDHEGNHRDRLGRTGSTELTETTWRTKQRREPDASRRSSDLRSTSGSTKDTSRRSTRPFASWITASSERRRSTSW